MSRTISRRRWGLVAAVVLAAVTPVALTACAGSEASAPTGSSTTTSAPDQSQPVDPLSVVTPNADPSTVTNLYLAATLGYFVDENVDVNIVNGAGAAGASLLVSGQADLLLSSATIAFPIAKDGQPVSLVFSDVGGGLGAAVTVRSDSTVRKLQDLSGLKVGTIGTTGATYGLANYLSSLVVDKGGKPFELVAFNDAATLNNALVSGQIDAVSASTGTEASLLQSGQARLIVDTTQDDQRQEYIGSEYTIDTAYEGLRDNLQNKQESVVRFLMALTRANQYLDTHTPEEIAKILQNNAQFSTLTVDQILASVKARFPFYTPYNGEISQDAWDQTLAWFTKWGIPSLGDVLNEPAFAYDEIIDMSYLNEAQTRLGPDALAPTGGPTP